MCQKIWVGVSPSLPIPKLTQYIYSLWKVDKNLGPLPLIRTKSKRTATLFGRSSLISKQCFEFTKLPAPYQQQWHHCCSVPILLRLVMMTCWIDKAKKTRAWNSWSLNFQEGEEKTSGIISVAASKRPWFVIFILIDLMEYSQWPIEINALT